MLFRKVLREVELPTWKSAIPSQYYDQVANLDQDLLTVAQKLKVPRRAVIPNPIAAEAHQYPIGWCTLLIMSDSSFPSRVGNGGQKRTSARFKSPATYSVPQSN